jgi:uncharacterized phage protein (TIGR01671 family)
MREIKFRAWDKINKVMLSVCSWEMCAVGYISTGSYTDRNGEEKTGGLVQEYEVMQYTGYKDSNGKECFHKDIISAYGYSNWLVEWVYNGWMLKQIDCENYKKIPIDYVVIGNQYENPELLKQ